MYLFFIALLVVEVVVGSPFPYFIQPKAGCSFNVANLNPEPIVVDTNLNFLYPEPSATNIQTAAGDSVIISCPGGTLSLGSSLQADNTITAQCQSGTTFVQNGKTFNFNQIRCSRVPFHTARYTGNSCENNGKEIELGFILTDNSFARDEVICFDDVNYISLYASYQITKSIGHHESGVDRPNFIQDDFFDPLNVRVNDLYARDGQRATINQLVGLSASSTKYVQNSNDYFLSRGHLAAKADFVYATQQFATFHYVNVAPQWQTVNGFNWNTLEMDVRDYAETNGVDLTVYTGTYGITTLPHEKTGEDIPLYLYVDKNGNKALPVPELYWKVAYNPATKQGIALLGLNNPYQKDVEKSIICQDISKDVQWLSWQADNLKAGYSYACDIEDFRKTVTYLPAFEVSGLLL